MEIIMIIGYVSLCYLLYDKYQDVKKLKEENIELESKITELESDIRKR